MMMQKKNSQENYYNPAWITQWRIWRSS